MRLKRFFLAFVAMMSFTLSAFSQETVIVSSFEELKAALGKRTAARAGAARSAVNVTTPDDLTDVFGTAKLGADIELSEVFTIGETYELTLDLNGYKITPKSGTDYHIVNLGSFTIMDESSTKTGTVNCAIQNGNAENNYAYLGIQGGTVYSNDADGAAVTNYGECKISGGKFFSEHTGLTNYNKMNIDGGDASNVYIEGKTWSIRNSSTLTVKNVVIAGTEDSYLAEDDSADATFENVTYFNVALNGKGYASLTDAIADANDGDLIRLFGEIDENATVTINKAITLDGNGKALSNAIEVTETTGTVEITGLEVSAESEYALQVESAATVKVTDSKLSGYGAVKAVAGSVSIKDTDLAATDNDVIFVATDVVVNTNGGSITASKSSDNAKFFIIGGAEGCTGAQLSIMTENIALGGAVNYVNLDTDDNTVKLYHTLESDLCDKGYVTDKRGISLTVYNAVANVDGKNYRTLAEALTAAGNGSTVTLLWADYKEPISMAGTVCGDKTVTVTGTAQVDWSKGWFYVGRNGEGNGKVIFNEANLTSASAKPDSGIGINVSGSKKGDNNTNDGTVEINNSTIDLDYLINKGTMSLDNSTLTVKNGFSIGGRPASETESGQDATATISLANNSKVVVNNHNGMGLGYEAIGVMNVDATSAFETTQSFLITAKGTMNVNGGTVKITGTLTNNGNVYVTDAANLAATVTGEGWFYMNGVSLDADTKLLGAKVRFASGTNTVDGSTIDDGIFQVGVGAYNGVDANVDTTNGVVVNVKNNAKIGSKDVAYGGWVGTGFYDTDEQKAAVMNGAKYVLNIDNSIAEFGYLHVSNDGELNVNGVPANKAHYNNSDYAFYAGDFIINGTANFNETDVLAIYTKVSCDNGTDKPGTLNINAGTEYEAERHNGAISANSNFTLYKTGVVNVAEGAELQACEASSIAADANLNIAGNATVLGTVTNNGTITLTGENATFTAGNDLNVGTTNIDKIVVYVDGAYKHGTPVTQTYNANGDLVGSYSDFEGAIAAAAADVNIARIEVKDNIAQTCSALGVTYNVAENQNLTIAAPEGENYTVSIDRATSTGETFSIYLRNANSSLNIAKNVTIEGLDILANGFGTAGNNTVIDGTLKAKSLKQWTSNGTITVSETGKVVLGYGDGQFDLAYGNGAVVVNGNCNGEYTTPQFKAGYSGTRGDGNTLTLNNTYFEAGAWFNLNGSNGTVNINNSLLKVSGGDAAGKMTIKAGNTIYVNKGSTLVCANITLETGAKIVVDGGTIEAKTVTNNGAIEVKGESTLNIETLTGETIDFLDGAIVKNSTVGGEAFVAGNVIFRGANTFAMLYDFGVLTDNYGTTAPMKWSVEEGASLTLTKAARYGLGYGDDVTVKGNIENALTARENLTEADRSLFMHGLVAQENKGWNKDNKLTVENAYVVLGSNNSFGNKPKDSKGNEYGGNYTFNFKNSVVDGSRITFYDALSVTAFTFDGCDVKIGQFMTRDADSKFTLKNSKVLSTSTTNGNDEGNYNAGELVLENTSLTYSAQFSNTGTLKLDLKSVLTAPSVVGDGTVNVDTEGITEPVLLIKGDMTGFTGTINVGIAAYKTTDEGLVVMPAVASIGTTYYSTLQEAIDVAVDGDAITLLADVKEDVTVVQAPDKKITINGAGNTLKGTITVDGKSARYATTALTIENVNFDATGGVTYEACINLGVDGNNNTRYTNNVTVKGCTFTDDDYSTVAVKSYTGGDWNLQIIDCTAEGMHSLAQLQNVEQGLVISGNTANTKNGINLNQTYEATVTDNIINVKGYAVRAGVKDSTGGNITLTNNTLKTDNSEGDPAIELRGAVEALNMTKNTVCGNTHIKGTAATIAVEENYWDGKSAPVVAEGSPAIRVNSYYTDEACNYIAYNHFGENFIGYTGEDRIWGEVWGNARVSFVIKVLDANGNVMGTTSLNDVDGIIDGDVRVTWNLLFDAESNTDPYWTMEWTTAPAIANMPASVQLWVDGAMVGSGPVQLNRPDNLEKKTVAITEGGNIKAFYTSLANAINSIGDGDAVIELLTDVAFDYNARDAYGTAGTTSVTINGNGNTLTLNQTNSDWSSFGLAAGKVAFNNVTIEKTGYGDTSGAWNTHAIIFSSLVEMTDVTVNNGIAVQAGATLNNVTINEANGYYGLWINGNGQAVTVNGCEINATNGGRGIKVADQYIDTPAQVTLNVTDTKFNTAKKAAVLVSSTAGAKVTANNVDITNVAADNQNLVWVDEDWAAYYNNIKVYDEATKAQENEESFPIKVWYVNGEGVASSVRAYYKNLDDLFAAPATQVPGSNRIELRGDVAAANKVDVNYGSNRVYSFVTDVAEGVTMTFNYADGWNMLPKFDLGENITMNVKSLQVIGGDIEIAGNLVTDYLYLYGTGEGVTITETGVVTANTGDATVQVKGGTVLTVNGKLATSTLNVWTQDVNNSELIVSGANAQVTAAHLHAWNGKDGVSAQKVNVENGATLTATNFQADRGSVVTVSDATVNSDKITLGYGDNIGTLVETGNSTINAPVNLSVNSTVTSDGGLNVTTDIADHKVVYEDGQYKVVPKNYVAQINGDAKFETLAEAVEAAEDGATVTLLNSVTGAGAVIDKDVTIDFAGYTYTFNEGVGSGDLTSNGFQILKGNTVTLKNGTLNVNADDAAEFYTIIQNYADLTVEDITLDGTNLDKWSATDGDSYVLSNNSGNVVIKGNTTIIANDEGDKAFAFDACTYQGYDAPVVTVETTGHIAGLIESTATIVIKSGTYTMDVTEWCAEGLTAEPVEVDGELVYTIVTGTTFIDGQFTAYNNAQDKEVEYIRYERNGIPTTWTTFYVPFEIPVSLLAEQGFEVAYINGVRRGDTDYDGELDKFVMEVIYIHGGDNCDGTGKTLKANYPYFIRSKGSERLDLVIELTDATLYAAQNATYDCTTFTEKFEITGTVATTEVNSSDNADKYIISSGEWSRRTVAYNLTPFRFYMTVTSRDNKPIKDAPASMSIVIRGEELPDGTTLIYDIEAETGDEFIFDLTGRRVLETEKGGIYIKNGKKVLVK